MTRSRLQREVAWIASGAWNGVLPRLATCLAFAGLVIEGVRYAFTSCATAITTAASPVSNPPPWEIMVSMSLCILCARSLGRDRDKPQA